MPTPFSADSTTNTASLRPDGIFAEHRYRVRLGRWTPSVPVLTSALFFGAMHVVLWPILGPAALVVICLAAILGLIAGHYREKTGSLIPAILIHAFFDIGGTLPWGLPLGCITGESEAYRPTASASKH